MGKPVDLLPGTLDMLILKAVSLRPLHGYAVLQRIRQISGEVFDIPQGSLYPALYRLEHQALTGEAVFECIHGRTLFAFEGLRTRRFFGVESVDLVSDFSSHLVYRFDSSSQNRRW